MTLRDSRSSSGRRDSRAGEFPDELYRQRSVQVAISGIIAALYATILIFFSYFSFGPVQVRVADSLMPLALVFGYAGAAGLAIGCLVGNYYGFMTGLTSSVDVLGGAFANLLAGIIGFKLYQLFVRRGQRGFAWSQLAILAENITVTLIVGLYMAVLYGPWLADYLLSLGFWYAGLFFGSLVSMNIIGYIVYKMTYVGLL